MKRHMIDDTMHYLDELCERSMQRGIPLFSKFLNLTEQKWAEQAANRAGCGYRLFGGKEDCEKRVLGVCGYEAPEEYEFPIKVLRFEPKNMAFAGRLEHRDVLGALMGLGFEREQIGDISVRDKIAYVFCLEKIADFVFENLTGIGRTAVNVSLSEPPEGPLFDMQEVHLRVTSLRLDALIAQLYKLSRGSAQELIKQGKVNIDDMECLKADFVPKDGQVVSVRGFGRARFDCVSGKTKKDKDILTVRLYR